MLNRGYDSRVMGVVETGMYNRIWSQRRGGRYKGVSHGEIDSGRNNEFPSGWERDSRHIT
jgi:hypothetical protein